MGAWTNQTPELCPMQPARMPTNAHAFSIISVAYIHHSRPDAFLVRYTCQIWHTRGTHSSNVPDHAMTSPASSFVDAMLTLVR